ncbi:hypothetical protein OBBRIDRAFT_829444 [Obba rivulosa]|uniref:Fungal-type protein kinase domain-containing protein n=1 Tax=Obba rivulosa TaxID=1052685 RepID=A0A8E2ALK8_9APHY|nr:hypothetical protein OBBRIDRAFT_829444 [Obba rivulosa]
MDSFPSFFRYHLSRPCHDNNSSSSSSASYFDEDTDISASQTDKESYDDESRDEVMPLPLAESEGLPKCRQVTPPPRHAQSAPDGILGSTHHKQNLTSVKTRTGYMDAMVEKYLADNFPPITRRDCPIIDFIQHIYGIDVNHIHNPSNGPIYIAKDLVNKFCTAPNERRSYDMFFEIMTSLVNQMDVFKKRNKFLIVNGKERILESQFVKNKPDVLVTMVGKKKQQWRWQGAVFELGRDFKIAPVLEGDIKVDLGLILQECRESVSAGEKRKLGDFAQADAHSDPKRAKFDVKTPAEDVNKAGESSMRHSVDVTQAEGLKQFTGKEKQTLKYINQLMSSGVRSYATVVLVQTTTVTIWYCDRVGLIISQPFDFVKDPHYLALLSAALVTADLPHFGVLPFLHFPDSKYTTFRGAVFKLETAKDADGEDLPGGVEFAVNETSSRTLHNGFGAVGRGTAVLPLKIPPALMVRLGSEDPNAMAKVAWPLIERPAEASLIKIIRSKLKGHAKGSNYLRHVPEVICFTEHTMRDLGLPRDKMRHAMLPDGHERICRIMVVKTYLPLRMVNSIDEFKTIFIGVVQGHHWVWEVAEVLHRDISSENIMFYRAGSEAVGILNDWDHAAEKDNIAINEFNFVEAINETRERRARKTGQTTASSDGQQISSLPPPVSPTVSSDDRQTPALPLAAPSELAADDESTRKPQTSAAKQARYRTGTGPFMTIELLSAGIIPFHRYRFDLESFLYVLVWFCVGFDPKTHEVNILEDWQHTDYSTIVGRKSVFLSKPLEREKVFDAALDEDYRRLCYTWAAPLCALFQKVQKQITELDTHVLECSENRPEEEQQYLEEWTRTAAGFERAREEAISYEKFIRVLGV